MDDTFADSGADPGIASGSDQLPAVMDGLSLRTRQLEAGANGFASAMARAFSSSVSGGKQFDDVLKSLVLRLSDMSLRLALQPLAKGLFGGLGGLFGGNGGAANLAAAMGAIKPFAAGGVVGTPSYFPLASGGLGLAGEAGPEAILPLARGPDGRLGVAAAAAPSANITIHIATPDVESFRRSEAYLSGQFARAVARGQRSL